MDQELIIRKITIGISYKDNSMHYTLGQRVYDNHVICNILDKKDRYSIYIEKEGDVMAWKDFYKTMAISVEYDLKY